mmetsp:Transcript_52917/g.158409  ORF Transcript_52917/g.158409 Transcript_52917/m.158409 type:complete len:387 (-) Transcript_52917:547-1707(-)
MTRHVFFFLPFLGFLATVVDLQCARADDHDQYLIQDPESTALVEWIRSRGGHVDHRQIVRNEIPVDPSSLRGVFAAQDIPRGTLLLYLPWSENIVADRSKGDSPDQCGTARALHREMALGEEGRSRYGPYVKMLNDQRDRIGLPNAWSGAGLALLDRIVGDNGLAPVDSQRHMAWWKSFCGGDPDNDPLGRDAALLMVMRACGISGGEEGQYRTAMIPYYDMYNHRNGDRWRNTFIRTEIFSDFKVLASRDIRAGEQIYNSYGEDAASALRDYGFLEQLPQLWSFDMPGGGDGGKIQFDLDEDDQGHLDVDWRVPPPMHALEFMRLELERLEQVEEKWKDVTTKGQTALPENESELAWGYHDMLKLALSTTSLFLERAQKDSGTEL